jgi:hypothetical protein
MLLIFAPSLSLLSILLPLHFALESVGAIVAARLSFWINRKALEDLKQQRVVLLLHAHEVMLCLCILCSIE